MYHYRIYDKCKSKTTYIHLVCVFFTRIPTYIYIYKYICMVYYVRQIKLLGMK